MSPPSASLRPLGHPVAIPGVSSAAARGRAERIPRHVEHGAHHHGPLYAGPTPVAPEGFVLSGSINLFGSSLVADYYEYHGPIPSDLPPDPVYQLAILKVDLKLPDIVPELRGTAFDDIALTDVMVTYQSASLDKTKLVGWTFEANLTIGKETGALYDVLTAALGVTELDVHLSVNLGGVGDQGWQRSVVIRSFVLEGTLPKVSVSPCEGVTLTQLGVRLLGIRTQSSLGEPSTLSFGFSVFGDIQLKVPHVLLPLQASFEIAELWGSVRLAATLKGDIWTDAFGIHGLNASDCILVRLAVTDHCTPLVVISLVRMFAKPQATAEKFGLGGGCNLRRRIHHCGIKWFLRGGWPSAVICCLGQFRLDQR